MKFDTSYRIIEKVSETQLSEAPYRRITPSYPKRAATILGMPAVKIEAVLDQSLFPIRYDCVCISQKSRMMFSAKIITFLELNDYLSMKGWELFTLDKTEIALPHERTSIT